MKEGIKMKIVKVKDYDELCQWTAKQILQKVRQDKKLHLGLATGSTPEGVYQYLAEDHRKNKTSYRQVFTYNLDEYVGLSADHPNSYHYYMNQHLFQKIDIPESHTHIPNGLAKDLSAECEQYEALIDQINGVDLQILGIGTNGHIGFNEPGTLFGSHTQVVELAPSTRKDNQRFFDSLDDVPTHAITMGIATILKSKQIFLLATGEHKANIIKRLITENVSQDLPASALKLHRNVTIVADHAALSQFDKDEVFGF